MWIYAWPIVLALPLIVPGRTRWWAVAGYLIAFLPLSVWAASVSDIPDMPFVGVDLSARGKLSISSGLGQDG